MKDRRNDGPRAAALKLPRRRAAAAALAGLLAILTQSVSARAEPVDVPELLRPYAGALAEVPRHLTRTGSLYVPAYSNLPASGGVTRASFAVTLSIRNPSPDKVLVVSRIAFFDTIGDPLQSYLERPIGLRPFGTLNLFLPIQDRRGGAGGNFQIDWAAEDGAPGLLAETIMLGEHGGASFSFISRGLEIGRSAEPGNAR